MEMIHPALSFAVQEEMEKMKSCLHSLLDFWHENMPNYTQEIKAILWLFPQENGIAFYLYADPFTPTSSILAPVKVACFGRARLRPAVKDYRWIEERAYIESVK